MSRPVREAGFDAAEDGRPARRHGSTPSSASPARRPTRATSACRACCTRASCAARIRTRASAASIRRRPRALPGVKAVLTHENAPGLVGRRLDCRRRAVQRRDQEDHEAAPLHLQQPGAVRRRPGRGRRRRRSARRRRGARSSSPSTTKCCRSSLDPEEALKPDAPKIWPEGNLSLNNRNEAAAQRAAARQRRRGVRRSADQVFEDRYSHGVRAQRADGAARLPWRTGTATS